MTKDSISSKLKELFELFKDGAITQEEYDLLKSQMINDKESQQSDDSKSVNESSSDLITNNKNNNSNDYHDRSELKQHNKVKIRRIAIIVVSLSLIFAAVIIIINGNSEWNESRATKKIMAELKNYPDWSSKTYKDSSTWYHHIVGFKKMSLSQKNVIVTVTISNEDKTLNNYGWCSIFEFDEKSRWKLKKKSIAFFNGEDYSSVLDDIYTISSDNYGLEIQKEDHARGGRSSIDKKIYSFIDKEFKVIFWEERKWQDPIGDRIFKLEFIDEGSGYYNIKSVDNENINSGYRYTSTKTTHYKFNGLEYVKE